MRNLLALALFSVATQVLAEQLAERNLESSDVGARDLQDDMSGPITQITPITAAQTKAAKGTVAGLSMTGDYSVVSDESEQKRWEVNWNFTFDGDDSWAKDDSFILIFAMEAPALNGKKSYETCHLKTTNQGPEMSNASSDKFATLKCGYWPNLDFFTEKKDLNG